jgi:putative DNA primase/helicase
MTGQPLLSIDNISGELRSDALCQLIERQLVEIRILGKSEMPIVETRRLSLFGTGVNVAIYGHLTRRILIASLDPEMEHPELRVFKANPVATVVADRGKYIAACLTLCRAYMVAGCPAKADPLASFEGWSDVVRSALLWLGQDDPIKSLDLARDEDPERITLLEVMTAWKDIFDVGKENAHTITDAIKAAIATKTAEAKQLDMLTAKDEAVEEEEKAAAAKERAARLKEALAGVCGTKTGKLDAKVLSYWLRNSRAGWG